MHSVVFPAVLSLLFLCFREGDNVRQRSPSLGNVLDGSATKSGRLLFESVREHYSPLKARVKLIKHFIENFRQHIFFLILFYGIVFGLFAERFYCEYAYQLSCCINVKYNFEEANQAYISSFCINIIV